MNPLRFGRSGLGADAVHRVSQQVREMIVGPGLQGTERAVSSGERNSDRWAQRDHWFGRDAAGIQSQFRGKSRAQ